MRLGQLVEHRLKQVMQLLIAIHSGHTRRVAHTYSVPVNAAERGIEMLVLDGLPDELKSLFAALSGGVFPGLRSALSGSALSTFVLRRQCDDRAEERERKRQ